MEFLWVWAYNLSGPITYICWGGLIICLLIFIQSMKLNGAGKSGAVSLAGVYGALIIGVVWALIASMPAPDYKKEIVYKDRIVEKPVVKKVIKMRQTITRTITKIPTRDARVRQCYDDPNNRMNWTECTNWAIKMEQPRYIEKHINHYIKVYSGVRVVEKFPTYDDRLRFCLSSNKDMSFADCHNLAKDAPEPKPTRVAVRVPSKFLDIYKYCNETFSLDGVANAAAVRNERLKICTDAAERGSK